MKKYLLTLLFIPIAIYSQQIDSNISGINSYAEIIDSVIKNSTGVPGEVFVNSINTVRNERAIGIQNTKISFFYYQKDDSVYDGDDGAVQFLPQYNPPLKIMVEYNIAASQTVVVNYYYTGNGILYRFTSSGGYGYTNKVFWIKNEDLLMYDEINSNIGNARSMEKGNFSKEVYSDGLIVIDHAREYKKMYYDLFKITDSF